MATSSAAQMVYVHADYLKDADGTHPLVPVAEPEPNDAAASPGLYEALEQQLWQGQPDVDAGDLLQSADVAEVLHPVAGIELDA